MVLQEWHFRWTNIAAGPAFQLEKCEKRGKTYNSTTKRPLRWGSPGRGRKLCRQCCITHLDSGITVTYARQASSGLMMENKRIMLRPPRGENNLLHFDVGAGRRRRGWVVRVLFGCRGFRTSEKVHLGGKEPQMARNTTFCN